MTHILKTICLFCALLAPAASLSPPVIASAALPVRTSVPALQAAKGSIPALGRGTHPTIPNAVYDATRPSLRNGQQSSMQAPVAPAIGGQWQANANRVEASAKSWNSLGNQSRFLLFSAFVVAAAAYAWWKTASKSELPLVRAEPSPILQEMKTFECAMAEQDTFGSQKFAVAAGTGESSARTFSKQRGVRQEKWIKRIGLEVRRDCRRAAFASGVTARAISLVARRAQEGESSGPSKSSQPGPRGLFRYQYVVTNEGKVLTLLLSVMPGGKMRCHRIRGPMNVPGAKKLNGPRWQRGPLQGLKIPASPYARTVAKERALETKLALERAAEAKVKHDEMAEVS